MSRIYTPAASLHSCDTRPRHQQGIVMQIGSVLLLFIGLVVAILFMGFKVVPQGFEWTVERFGRYTNTLKPGLNIIIPIMDRIGRKMNVMESVLDIPPLSLIHI